MWPNKPWSPNLFLHALCCRLSLPLEGPRPDTVFLILPPKCHTDGNNYFLWSAVCAFLNVVNLHCNKVTLPTYIQLAVQEECRCFFTKLLISLLFQVLNFFEFHEASARPLLQLEFQWTALPGQSSSACLRGYSNTFPRLLIKLLCMGYQPSLLTAVEHHM